MTTKSETAKDVRGPLRISVGASSGHMAELLRLLEHADRWPCLPTLYVTTGEQFVRKIRRRGHVECVGECNRRSPLKILKVAVKALGIVMKHRPNVLITTGSLPLAIVAIWVRMFGGKVVWIDSIANMRRFSMSGRLVYRFADLFITQWDDVASRMSRARYFGQIV
jgi:hypothetical protein